MICAHNAAAVDLDCAAESEYFLCRQIARYFNRAVLNTAGFQAAAGSPADLFGQQTAGTNRGNLASGAFRSAAYSA
jgi:hypothetical protein